MLYCLTFLHARQSLGFPEKYWAISTQYCYYFEFENLEVTCLVTSVWTIRWKLYVMSMFLFLFRVSAKTILSRFLGFLKKNESWDPWIHFPRKWRHSPIGNLKFPHLLWHWDDHPIKLLHLDDFSCVVTSVSKFKLQIIHAMKYLSRCVRCSYTRHLYSEL